MTVPASRAPAPRDREAFTIAMALVPSAFSRNRHFDLHANAVVREARARSAILRGVARQLAGANGEARSVEVAACAGGQIELRYRVPDVHLDRTILLTSGELSCLRRLLSKQPGAARRGAIDALRETDADRATIDNVLRRLMNDPLG